MSDLTARLRLTADGREFIAVLEQAGVKVDQLDSRTKTGAGGMRALDAAGSSATASLQNMASRAGPLGASLAALGPAGLGAAAAIGALTLGLTASFSAAAEAEKVQLRLGAVLKATGNASGFSRQQILDYSGELQRSLKINDEAITAAATVMATFRAVSGETFKESIRLAADMSAVFGGDLSGSATQLGKALQDPVQGMSALARVGVTFSDSQKEVIRALQETGDVAGAQQIILEELRGQVGGAAAAEAGGLSGAARGLANVWDDLLETLGRTPAVGGVAKSVLGALTGQVETITKLIAGPTLKEEISALEEQIRQLSVPEPDIARRDSRAAALRERQEELLALQDSVEITKQQNDQTLTQRQFEQRQFEQFRTFRVKEAAERNAQALSERAQYEAFAKSREAAEQKAADTAKKAAEERARELEDGYQARRKVNDLVRRQREEEKELDRARAAALEEFIAGVEKEAQLSGLSANARRELAAIEQARKAAGLAANEALAAGDQARIRAALAVQTANEAALKQQEEIAASAQRMADDIAGFLVDGFVDASEGGKSAFEDMWDAALGGGKRFLANIAAEILKQNFILPITTAIVGSAPGLFGINGGGGGSGALGTAANGASLANFLSGGALTAGISAKLFGTAAVGVAAGAQGPILPATSGLLASGGFAGSGIATALPYIGAGVAALGILKGLGVLGKNSVGPNAGAQLIESGGVFSAGPSGADNGGSTAGVIQEVTQAVQVLNALASGIGVAQIGDGLASYIDTFKAGGIGNAADLVKDAIGKGVIEGLTAAEQALISASGDVAATAAEIIENRALPGAIADRLLQREDPAAAAQKLLDAEFDGLRARVAAVNDNGVTLANLERLYQLEVAEIQSRFATGAGAAISAALSAALLAQDIAFERLDGAYAVLEKSVAAERTRITGEFNDGLKRSQDALKGFNDNVARLGSLSGALKSALGGLDQPGELGANRAGAQRQISDALLAARNGGTLPDEASLRDALSVIQKPSEGLFETFTDYQRDFIKTRNDIAELSGYAGWQLAKAESQAQLLERQIAQDRAGYDAEITRLNGILETAQAQIEAIKGVAIAVMNVEDALRALSFAQGGARTAARAAEAADPVSSLYRTLLGRQADAGGAGYWNASLASGASTLDVTQNIIRGAEFGAVAQPGGVEGLYTTLLGRAPDAAGLAYWNNALAGGQSLQEIALDFTRGQEYADLVKIRGFARGGEVRPNETIMVGEMGRELFTAGPTGGFVTPSGATGRVLDNSAVVARLEQIAAQMARLERLMADNTRHASRTASLLHSVTQDGQSLMTKAAA